MFKTLLKSIMSLIINISKKIFNLIMNKMRPSSDKHSYTDAEDAYFYDDNWDLIMDVKRGKDNDKDNVKTMIEEYNDVKKRSFVQVTDRNKIILIFDHEKDSISTINVLKIEENPYIEFMMKDKHIGAIVNVQYKTLKFRSTCAHLLSMMNYEQTVGFKHINKMLVVDSNAIKIKESIWSIHKADEINWWTKDLGSGSNVFITTTVQSPIIGYIKYKGRSRISCIAIITSFKPEAKYVYSGTLMTARNKPFIVTYVHDTPSGIKSVIAVALLNHDYEIIAK